MFAFFCFINFDCRPIISHILDVSRLIGTGSTFIAKNFLFEVSNKKLRSPELSIATNPS